jgi:uncharacterized protein YcaQ
MIASEALGIATEIDLRDYFRLPVADMKQRLAELVADRSLEEVAVEGWKQKAYMRPATRIPRESSITPALLSPFDSLIWARPRTERLFNFHYRLAFYTPAHKRTQGYYVMPFLHDGRLVARVDVKSDRKAGRLLVLGGHAEPGTQATSVAGDLSRELAAMATWLGLERVKVQGATELLRALRRA